MALTPTAAWDETAPANTDQVGDGDDALRNLKRDLRERLAVGHNFHADETGQTNLGDHKEGSARVTEDTYANIPSAALAGRVFFASDREQLFIDDGSAWDSGPSRQHRYLRIFNSTGTVAVTNGATAVTGTGTNFSELGSGSGWLFHVSGERWYPVASVTNDTTLTLSAAYAGSTQSGVNYELGNPNDHPHLLPAYNASVNTITIATGTLGSNLAAGTYKVTGLGDATANGDALRYEHKTAATIDHPAGSVTAAKIATSSLVAQIKIGTYTGNGAATQAITGVTFQPTLVLVYKQSGTYGGPVIKTSSDSGNNSKRFDTGGWDTDMIRSLDADGFTVGDASQVNVNATTYTFVAVKGL